MKFDPCYEYFKQYKADCEEWVRATKELYEFQSGCLTQGKVWHDVNYSDLKKLSDWQSKAKEKYFESLNTWMDCKEGKI